MVRHIATYVPVVRRSGKHSRRRALGRRPSIRSALAPRCHPPPALSWRGAKPRRQDAVRACTPRAAAFSSQSATWRCFMQVRGARVGAACCGRASPRARSAGSDYRLSRDDPAVIRRRCVLVALVRALPPRCVRLSHARDLRCALWPGFLCGAPFPTTPPAASRRGWGCIRTACRKPAWRRSRCAACFSQRRCCYPASTTPTGAAGGNPGTLRAGGTSSWCVVARPRLARC